MSIRDRSDRLRMVATRRKAASRLTARLLIDCCAVLGLAAVAALTSVAATAAAAAAPGGPAPGGPAPRRSATLEFPPLVVPASMEHHVGKVIWADLVTPDLAGARTFYGGLFGWTFREVEGGGRDFLVAYAGQQPVAGMVRRELPKDRSRQPAWIPFIAVRNVGEARQVAIAQGAGCSPAFTAIHGAANKPCLPTRKEQCLRYWHPAAAIRPRCSGGTRRVDLELPDHARSGYRRGLLSEGVRLPGLRTLGRCQ